MVHLKRLTNQYLLFLSAVLVAVSAGLDLVSVSNLMCCHDKILCLRLVHRYILMLLLFLLFIYLFI